MMFTLKNLTIKVDQRELIKQLSLDIHPGEMWLVIGQNGVGKSTLLESLVGLKPTDMHAIYFNEQPLSTYDALSLAYQRAWLPQRLDITFGFSVYEYLLASCYARQVSLFTNNSDDEKKVLQIAQEMELMHLVHQDMRTLSGGEQKRVALAAVLTQNTPLLFLDEPFSSLDISHQMFFVKQIKKCLCEQKSIVIATHDINVLRACATHILLLYGNGQWEAARVQDLLTPQKLSQCLGYPIIEVGNGSRNVFVAQ